MSAVTTEIQQQTPPASAGIFRRGGWLTGLVALAIAAAVLWLFAQVDEAHWQGFQRQRFVIPVAAANHKSWRAGFDMWADKQAVHLEVAIHLLAQPGISRVRLEQVKTGWRQAIGQAWNHRFAVRLSNGEQLPLFIDVRWDAVSPNHEVIVRKGNGAPDQHNWFYRNRPAMIAHEFGHMLGAYDEYPGGAVAPGGMPHDGDNLMRSASGNRQVLPRHLARVQQSLRVLTGQPELEIVLAGPQNTGAEGGSSADEAKGR